MILVDNLFQEMLFHLFVFFCDQSIICIFNTLCLHFFKSKRSMQRVLTDSVLKFLILTSGYPIRLLSFIYIFFCLSKGQLIH